MEDETDWQFVGDYVTLVRGTTCQGHLVGKPGPALLVGPPLYKRLAQSVREAQTLAAVRDTPLPKLISGQLRVPDALKMTEAA